MTRLAAAFWVLLVLGSGFATFTVKYAVQGIEEQLNRVRKQTIAEQQEMRVLNAEWTYLNQPERLADLNRRFIGLVPIAAHQLEARIEQIPFRAPAAPLPPSAALIAAAPVPAAPSAPHPIALAAAPTAPTAMPKTSTAASATPASPATLPTVAVAAPAALPAASPTSPATLDALIAQIEPAGEPAPIAAVARGTAPQRAAPAAPPASLAALIARIGPAATPIPTAMAAEPKLQLAKSAAPRSIESLIARIAGRP